MEALTTLLIIYGLLFISLYIHEVFHFPKKIIILKWLPFPQMAAIGTKEQYRYTALCFNTAVALLVWYFNPSNIYLKWLGLINWIYVILYFIFGSINFEPKIKASMRHLFVMDDIKNSHIWIFFPAAFLLVYYLQGYYIPILLDLIGGMI